MIPTDKEALDTDVQAKSFPIEEVARHPLPGMAIPDQIRWSPDDKCVTFLWSPERTLERQLYSFDPASGAKKPMISREGGGTTEDNVSIAEALRRERMRQREIGITTYAWAQKGKRLLVPIKNDLFVQDGPDAPLRLIHSSKEGAPQCPRLSPDGSLVAYVSDAELHVVSTDGGAPRQITFGARGTGKTHGLAEFVAQEEMGRYDGFWWSPCGTRIAFTEVDETHIPVYRIVHQGKDAVGPEAQEDHHYPFAGKDNAKVRLAVVGVADGKVIFLDTDYGEETYLARVDWLKDGRLVAQIQDRRQTWLEIVAFDMETGKRSVLVREETDVWINLHDLFRPLENGGFLWASERTGFRHLYRYDGQGKLIAQLTSGAWMLDDICGIDEKRNRVFFTATAESPLESHLYVVSLDGGTPKRITTEAGMHAAVCDHACDRFVDVHHELDQPPTVKLRSLETGEVLGTIFDEVDPRIEALGLKAPEVVSLSARDGEKLFGAVYKPASKFGPGPYPTIVYVYGGPHVQLVTRGFSMTVMMRAQYLRSLGFLVLILDNRGSARRGLAFEGKVKHCMGSIEVDDQVDGVRWLVSQGLADPARVGVCGWSYGGYMSAMCLAKAPDTFRVAVAGAPVTHWDGYDTHYTERYMGLPHENAKGYEESSVMHHVAGIRGKLMLVHGMIDENVHFRHTARLINAMIKARKPYDLLAFPDERHMPRRLSDKVYMEELVCRYFVERLK
ncbi:MAG: S9 family peptidase [Polyangiaceae bacterium]|nr:S9 family peptidase [Polyangiaceae bacterium]